jgi:hypothetical protein
MYYDASRMRSLEPAPSTLLDDRGQPRFGSYRGGLPTVDLGRMGRGGLYELTHRKRWIYVAIASEEVYLGVAAVHLGYLSTLFAFAFDRKAARVVVDRSLVAPPIGQIVADTAGEGCDVRVKSGASRISFRRARGASAYDLDVSVRDLSIRAQLESKGAPPPIGVVARIPGGVVNTTEKGALLDVRGEATLVGRRVTLDGALGGYDYTQGLLARRTSWRWAFALGRAKTGERVGLNLVEGFVGEPECAAWIDGELHPLAVGRFTFDPKKPLAPWQVRTDDGGVDLRFEPAGLHAEHKNFGVIASRFVQPVGTFSGTLAVQGRSPLELDRVLGVTEDQDVLW